MNALKRLLAGRDPDAERRHQRVEQEIINLRHELKNSIQVVQSGNRLIETMSGAISLSRPRQETDR